MRRKTRFILLGITVLILLALCRYTKPLLYTGNNSIILLETGYTGLSHITQAPALKGKVIYVDIWGTNCPSCFHEFRNFTPQLTARYRNNKNMAFVYICIDRHPFAELRWKEKINQFRPEGIHILVHGEQEEIRLAHDITGTAVDGKYFPYQPYYFIIDKGGKNITPKSIDPEKGELRPGDTELLFRKLDDLVN